MIKTSALVCGLLLPLVIAGCGGKDDGPERFPVSGTVTFDGAPVADGEIRFLPIDGNGAADATRIIAGRFETTATAGPKRVEVTATREVPGKMVESAVNPGQMEPAIEEYIPAQYNTDSTLGEEVNAAGPNTFTFDLKSGS